LGGESHNNIIVETIESMWLNALLCSDATITTQTLRPIDNYPEFKFNHVMETADKGGPLGGVALVIGAASPAIPLRTFQRKTTIRLLDV
jgi:hypothetical protein